MENLRHESAPPDRAPAAVPGRDLFSRYDPVPLPASLPPLLAVVVDTEEEFEWSAPFSRGATSVTAMRGQERAQRLLERYRVVPTYAITYPVATQPDGYRPLQEFLADGACAIGAHQHPWVTPPFDEPVTDRTSIAGNLAAPLERAKLARLTDVIADRFGRRPVLHKAGRYGIGPSTEGTLEELGYLIDASVLPGVDLRHQHAADYRRLDARPHRIGDRAALLELPTAAGFAGHLAETGLPPRLPARGRAARITRSLLSRTGLIERITLTPEGVDHAAHRRLLRALIARGQRVFTLSYHSPSLVPGHTPYVRSAADLERFLDTLERTLDHVMGDLGGRPTTPEAVLMLARTCAPHLGLPDPLAPDHDAEGLREDREVECQAPVL